ncbi:serine endopeptidase [Massilia arenosa]|uniref:Serine endopeptidase n=1 Tax=Zemynaea arenosa TaxID=2561931 RepID=A0A4Y9S2X6_9BURK|nr:zinc ribbon domain-containing protein [Massilia arenosa]TFW15716.1 serine endopeptidase [Massilia arenosa]
MSKGLRLSERWFQRGLWLVALVFAAFLIGLGGKVVDNLHYVEKPITAEQFIDPVQGPQVQAALSAAEKKLKDANDALEQAQLAANVASNNYRTARETFDNWLRTRQVTARPEQDPELIARNRELDTLKAAERKAQGEVEAQQQNQLDASQAHDRAQAQWNALNEPAIEAAAKAARAAELRVFLYRLMLTLPLLAVAAWLFVKKRRSIYWPFVWGFIFFAGFAFFVELVPYLPSYGGYVRYTVGIVLTVVIGRYVILALQRYLARQKAAEAMPEEARRETLSYDTALARLAKSVCPGCERQVDLKDPALDFCPHCGIGLFDRCGHCTTRKGAFARYCFACGTPAQHVGPVSP